MFLDVCVLPPARGASTTRTSGWPRCLQGAPLAVPPTRRQAQLTQASHPGLLTPRPRLTESPELQQHQPSRGGDPSTDTSPSGVKIPGREAAAPTSCRHTEKRMSHDMGVGRVPSDLCGWRCWGGPLRSVGGGRPCVIDASFLKKKKKKKNPSGPRLQATMFHQVPAAAVL